MKPEKNIITHSPAFTKRLGRVLITYHFMITLTKLYNFLNIKNQRGKLQFLAVLSLDKNVSKKS